MSALGEPVSAPPLARSTGLAERPVFVAVGNAGAGSDPTFAARHAERRGLPRRLQDAALAATVAAAPGAAVCHLLALTAAASLMEFSPGLAVWAGAGGAAGGAWALITKVVPRRRRVCRDTRLLRQGLIVVVTLAMLMLAAAPWLAGGAASPADGSLVRLALGTAALSGAAALAPMPVLSGFTLLLVLSPALAAWWQVAAPAPGLPGGAMVTLWLGLAVGVTAWRGHRVWLRGARAALAGEDRLRQREGARDAAQRADQEKSRFLAIASHDLRQPVHALGLFAATLEKRLRGSAEEPLVRNLVRSIDGLDRSFYAMLDISRLDAGSVEPNFQHFPLRDLFRRLHMHFAGQAEQCGLNLRFSPGGKSVTSDPQLLERVLGNLIQNAIKYTEQGGIAVVVRSTATHFNVEIWDTGAGIAREELPRVFDEFYQVGKEGRRRAQGLGMGLAIVKRLVSLLEHSLTVTSAPGRGTMFRIGIARGELPEIQDATAPADTVPMQALQPRTVLIVEDDEAIREGLSLLLEEWGYQSLVAASAEQALRVLRTLELPPNLILSDLHLGPGLDGIAAIAGLRRECACDVPAILITGDTSHEEIRRATESGHPVLFKPVQPRKLLNALRGLMS